MAQSNTEELGYISGIEFCRNDVLLTTSDHGNFVSNLSMINLSKFSDYIWRYFFIWFKVHTGDKSSRSVH